MFKVRRFPGYDLDEIR